jgi:hypothetical protein
MTKHVSYITFALVGAIGYVLAYAFNWPVFAYYPLIKEFHFAHTLPASAGPAMLYYGWITTAAIAALILALVVPRSIAAKLWPGLGWLVPLVLILYTFVYTRHWFL